MAGASRDLLPDAAAVGEVESLLLEEVGHWGQA